MLTAVAVNQLQNGNGTSPNEPNSGEQTQNTDVTQSLNETNKMSGAVEVNATQYPFKDKFESGFFDKISALEQNGSTRLYNIVIRLVNDTPELKDYACSILMRECNATIDYVGKVLPWICAKVPVPEVRNVAAYDFIALIGDGEKPGIPY